MDTIESMRQARTIRNTSTGPMSEKLLMTGEVIYAEGNITTAVTYYDKVLAPEPNNLGAFYDKGLALDVLGQQKEAITYYDKLLSVQPDLINALIHKGAALADLGKYHETIVYFDRALAIEPNNALAAEDKELAESYAFTDIPYSVN
jgi:tetratricopeptide (TPR) repeat protein